MAKVSPRVSCPLGHGRRLHPTRFASNNLVSERQIALAPLRLDVVEQDRLSEARALRKSHIAGNYRSKNHAGEMFPDVLCDLVSNVGPGVEHREEDSFRRQRRVQTLLDQVDGV